MATALAFSAVALARSAAAAPPSACPPGFKPHAPGFWDNPIPDFRTPTHPVDEQNATLAKCAAKCSSWPALAGGKGCVGFEVYGDAANASIACYIFVGTLKLPFEPLTPPAVTCVSNSYVPPPPPHTPPNRGRTTGHTFPRLGNCWGPDTWITPEMWAYEGFPNVTNSTWGAYDVLYINPFDSCCWKNQIDSWAPIIRAIKASNPKAVVLATFHATEIWGADLAGNGGWLPEGCQMRNTDGSVCSWWVGLVTTNNLFRAECFQAAVDNALGALNLLVPAGVDGVFLDGVVPYDIGCATADVNCTAPGCPPTPNPPSPAALTAEWSRLYAGWFEKLKAVYPKFIWVNNLLDQLQPGLINVSNGRMVEGTDGEGLNAVFAGSMAVSARVAATREWSTQALQPSYVLTTINSDIQGSWRVGRWQNLVTGGEMSRVMTEFQRMRFGLGVTMLTDGYFSNDLGGGWYGQPTWYTEYGAPLGQAVADPVLVDSVGHHEIWTREFDGGFVVVSSRASGNYTLQLPAELRGKLAPLPLSADPAKLTGQREAPAWQLVIDNDVNGDGGDGLVGHSPASQEWRPAVGLRPAGARRNAGVHPSHRGPATPQRLADWWADDSRRAAFRTTKGNWTVVSDESQSHQVGNSFAVGFAVPGQQPQGAPPDFEATYTFVSPATDRFDFSVTAVNAHLYPSTDAAGVCVRPAGAAASVTASQGGKETSNANDKETNKDDGCIASGVVDQSDGAGPLDGRWRRALSGVPLAANQSYEFVLTWLHSRGGYVVADALLVESATTFHGAGAAPELAQGQVVIGPMDARVLVKK